MWHRRALRGVAGDLGEVSSRVKAVMASLRAQVAGEAAGIACALAPGDATSFHAHCDHVHTTVDPADTGVLDYLGELFGPGGGCFRAIRSGLGRRPDVTCDTDDTPSITTLADRSMHRHGAVERWRLKRPPHSTPCP